MPPSGYDVIVVGLGSMGGSAARELASRGLSVLGLEKYRPAHDRGSAHGDSRIIRQSYFEGAAYVPLLQRAYAGWRELEDESGSDLLTLCGGVYVGDADNPVFAGALRSAQIHGLEHEVLDAGQIHSRFPPMLPRSHARGLFEANAGFTRPERTVLANIDVARRGGADLRFDEPVTDWTATNGSVEVRTERGHYRASRLVLCPGAWAPEMLAEYAFPITVQRQVVYWFSPEFTAGVPYAAYTSDAHPVFIEETDGNGVVYGFPMIDGPDGGMKIAYFDTGIETSPNAVDRAVHGAEVEAMRLRALQLFPSLSGPLLKAQTCLYSTTPDAHFIIGTLPDRPQVAIAVGFSGHGFKFVPVVGEILADLVLDGASAHDLELFRLDRPALTR